MAKCFDSSELVLNYHDAVIYGSDLALVQSRVEWLNDACINFFFTLLQHWDDAATNVAFMDPSVVSFFVHQCTDDEDIEDFASSFSIPREGKIFVPVNDNMAHSSNWQTPRGGCHWSLLVVQVATDTVQAWHFDSVRGSGNRRAAEDIWTKFSQCMFQQKCMPLYQAKTPQQVNGYDCGVHMLAAAQHFASMEETDVEAFETRLQGFVEKSPKFCETLRAYIVSEVLRLAGQS